MEGLNIGNIEVAGASLLCGWGTNITNLLLLKNNIMMK